MKVALLHVVGNAVLLYAAYLWLGMRESDNARLAASFLFVLLVLVTAVFLHGSGFAYFHLQAPRNVASAMRNTLRNLLPLVLLTLFTLVAYWLLAYWRENLFHLSFLIASWITITFRKPLRPDAVLKLFYLLIAALRWSVLPFLLLPTAAAITVSGWSGFRPRFRWRRSTILYWIEITGLLLSGIWLALKIATWAPEFKSFGAQFLSFSVRLTIAYLLFVVSSLLIEFVTSTGMPRSTQDSTAALP